MLKIYSLSVKGAMAENPPFFGSKHMIAWLCPCLKSATWMLSLLLLPFDPGNAQGQVPSKRNTSVKVGLYLKDGLKEGEGLCLTMSSSGHVFGDPAFWIKEERLRGILRRELKQNQNKPYKILI